MPRAVLLATLVVALGCKGQAEKRREEAGKRETPMAAPAAPNAAPLASPRQEAAGEVLVAELKRLVDETDEVRAAQLADSLRLADPAEFFADVFGAAAGARLAGGYQRDRSLAGLASAIRYSHNAHQRNKVSVEAFTDAADPRATGLQAIAIGAMVNPTTLYSVRYETPGGGPALHIFNFAHDGVRFRYIGFLVELVSAPPSKIELARLRQRQGAKAGSP